MKTPFVQRGKRERVSLIQITTHNNKNEEILTGKAICIHVDQPIWNKKTCHKVQAYVIISHK
eukprot:TRINITY_DN10267_c0_g1_i1.p2 TRINITY_DN10267_c0_g1~~TRINITY_DN10267_c0_g1_i1.p2  ORF type:complete len:62 (-),score=4.09 TRINITY_DN10267_c0_g1_i1:373-558(-)